MVSIIADDREIERCLERLLAQAQACGATFAEALVLRCAEGNLTVELGDGCRDEILIKMPEHALAPLESFRLALSGDDIVIAAIDPDVSRERAALMETMLELYNRTGKISQYRKTSTYLFLGSHPELARLVARGRGAAFRNCPDEPQSSGGGDHFVLREFLNTRRFNLPGKGDKLSQKVLMPVIDLMNHHFQGCPFEVLGAEDTRYLCIDRARSQPRGDRECFARYGPYDCMDMLVAYNFLDTSSPNVLSVPLEITFPDLGTIKVGARVKALTKKRPPAALQDLAGFLPKIVSRGPKLLEVTSLTIPGPTAPQALRRVLNLLIATVDTGCLDRFDLIVAAEEQVIRENESYYASLKGILDGLSVAEPTQGSILNDFKRMCDDQLGRIESYKARVRDQAA